jgi:hypothetical protein
MTVPKHIEVMARGICREKCAFMGEPPCFTVMDGSPFTWPPETCCEPGCISEATAAHAALVRLDLPLCRGIRLRR